MSKTARVAELALSIDRNSPFILSEVPGISHRAPIGRIAADAAALVRLADTVTACDAVECNGGAVDGDDYGARVDNIPEAWACVNRGREARVAAADKRRTRALAKAAKLAGAYGLSVFHQGDPRGASLYLYDAARHGEPHAGWDQHAPGVVCV